MNNEYAELTIEAIGYCKRDLSFIGKLLCQKTTGVFVKKCHSLYVTKHGSYVYSIKSFWGQRYCVYSDQDDLC